MPRKQKRSQEFKAGEREPDPLKLKRKKRITNQKTETSQASKESGSDLRTEIRKVKKKGKPHGVLNN